MQGIGIVVRPCRAASGGKVAGRSFGVSVGLPGRFDLNKLGPMLSDLLERLAGAIIENLPWQAFIDRYDRPETLFYLDPPYWGSEDDYGKGMFGREQFEALAERLRRLEGLFILSINDIAETREIFREFPWETAELTYSISQNVFVPAKELIVLKIQPSFGRAER